MQGDGPMGKQDDVALAAPVVAPKKRRRHGLIFSLAMVFLAATLVIGALALTGKPIRLPVWAVAEAETRLNTALALGENALSLDGIEVTVDRDWIPRLRLLDLRITRRDGSSLVALPEARVAFDPGALLRGRLRPSSVVLSGTQIDVRRDASGRFDLEMGRGTGTEMGSFADLLDRVDEGFALPVLENLASVQADALSLTLQDARAGKTWQVGDGRLTLENRASEVAMELGLTVVADNGQPAQAVLSFISQKASSEARIRATVETVAARDIAAQAPPLAFLGVLDAPISGKFSTGIDASGAVQAMEGSLTLAAGSLRPSPEARAISFDRASLSLAYAPQTDKITLTEVAVESASLRLQASGHVYAPGVADGVPDEFLSQISFARVMVDPEGLFTEPVTFSQGALDLRLRVNPFRVDVGQLVLVEDGRRLEAKGTASADDKGWTVAVDLGLNEIAHDRMLALWPVSAVPKTRAWLVENVQEGLLSDVKAALRVTQGAEPRFSLGYEFADADVRFLKTLPPIKRGYGYATIEGNSYTMVLDRGAVTPPKGGSIDMAGSVFSVLDILQIPAQAEIRLKTDSTLTAALSLLDEKPFGFLTKAGRPVELGTGRAQLRAVLRLPLVQKVLVSDVSYQIEGDLSDVHSEVLVPGRVLAADALRLTAGPSGMEIAGKGTLSGVPFDGVYAQKFGPEAQGRATVTGVMELSPRTLDAFKIALPKGSVTGTGQAAITVDLQRDTAPELVLTSDLRGNALSIPQVGFAKGARTAGKLMLSASLGAVPKVDNLTLEAPGISASGSVSLREGGTLDKAVFDRVRVGDWLDAGLVLTGRGKGAVGIALTGGSLDLRRMETGGSGSGQGSPMDLALDRVQVSEGIALTGFRGQFSPQGGMNGSFTAKVNGVAPVQGTVVPTAQGSAVRILSDNAGSVLASAGIFDNARGGTMDLRLTPTGQPGHYQGKVTGQGFRVRNAPVLAELLSAISVVGILEQLNGEGLVFNDADAEFRLTPAAIEVTRSAAVGASMGVSMAGVYNVATKRLDMQGVISPIYILNGIGAVLTRKGEGLFGFNYHLGGTSENPSVSVNPLSILTPGMFREIFRRPAPRIGG